MTVGELLGRLGDAEYVGTIPVYLVNGFGELVEVVQVSWVAATETQPEMVVIQGGEEAA